MDFEENPLLKVYPPLRSEEHRKALWQSLSKIPIIASDHAPHTIEDKKAGAAGIPGGLETEVALLLDATNRGGLMTIFDIVEKMHDNPPVRFFGIKGRDFSPGNEATFTIADPPGENGRSSPRSSTQRQNGVPGKGKS